MSNASSENVTAEPKSSLSLVQIGRIEDLDDVARGAGLRVMQHSRGSLTGTLAIAAGDGMALMSAHYEGKVSLVGPLAQRDISIGLGLDVPGGSRHWLREVRTGDVAVFRPGDELDVTHAEGSLYMTFILSEERLMEAAEFEGLLIDLAVVQHSGMHPRSFPPEALDVLRRYIAAVHRGAIVEAAALARFQSYALSAVIGHLGRVPLVVPGMSAIRGQERIVARARAFIDAHLDEPISVNDILVADGASRRTLFRAFVAVIEETPQAYVTRLRLHRIRSDLMRARAAPRIDEASHRWAIGEVGRMSGRYKALFGELPSESRRFKRTTVPSSDT
jgi:AraC-like DNA-binding protein